MGLRIACLAGTALAAVLLLQPPITTDGKVDLSVPVRQWALRESFPDYPTCIKKMRELQTDPATSFQGLSESAQKELSANLLCADVTSLHSDVPIIVTH
jgi:hypothetical protein